MTISPAGIEIIKRHEALSLVVYDDQAGLPTIGYGHLIKAGEPFTSESRLTQAEAEALFAVDLRPFVEGVDASLEVEVLQSQFDALVSFAFNVGLGALRSSSFLRAVNSQEPNEVIVEKLMRWNKVTNPRTKQKEVSSGLTRRRAEEAKAWPL